MLRIWKCSDGGSDAERKMLFLELEGHLKGMLTRFIPRVDTAPSFVMSEVGRLHPEIKKALQWLEGNYARMSVLEELQVRSGLTPNYFRTCFKAALSITPSDYIKQLRLRHARYLLHETDWQQKRIASEIGYSDPLYFSRLYRQFWGHSPSQERATKSYLPLKS